MRTFIFKPVIAIILCWGLVFSPDGQAYTPLPLSFKIPASTPETCNEHAYDIEKSKKISKVFKVSASDKLDIDNKFGKVHINTWDKNEIAIDVVMIARSNTEARAQSLLDKIDVKISQSAGLIAFRTELESNHSKGKQSFEINYTISMPRGNPLRLKNSFGDAYLANYQGKADIDIGYGSLKTDQLSGQDNTIKIAFGSGNLSNVKGGKIDVSYSELNLANGETIDLKTDFSDVEIERIKDLTIRSKYGDVKLGTVSSLQGSSSFSGFRINELSSQLDMKVQYCGDFEVSRITKNFKLVNVDGGFSTIQLSFDKSNAFHFDVATSFGNFRLDDALQENGPQFSLIEKKNTSSHCIGKVGKPGTAQVKVKTQYGDVRIDQAK